MPFAISTSKLLGDRGKVVRFILTYCSLSVNLGNMKRENQLHGNGSSTAKRPAPSGLLHHDERNTEDADESSENLTKKYEVLLKNRRLSVDLSRTIVPSSTGTSKTDSDTVVKNEILGLNNSTSSRYISFISCGSFNPITNMHLRMFEMTKDYIEQKYSNAKVESGIISPVSDAYAKQGLEAASHRLVMCSLAIEDNPWLHLSTWESDQPKWKRTVEVLRNSRDQLRKKRCDHELMLLCGADLLDSFNTPGLWTDSDLKEIVEDFGIIVVQRPNYDPRKLIYENDLLYSLRDNIHVITDWISNDVSSTKLRRACRRNESIRYLTHDDVVSYIEKNGLYRDIESENKNAGQILAPYRSNAL